jgi:hypothetical protein
MILNINFFQVLFDRFLQFISHFFIERVVNVIFKFLNFILSIISFFEKKERHKEIMLDILYKSSNFLVVNKQHDLLCNSNDSKKVSMNFRSGVISRLTFFFVVALNRLLFKHYWRNNSRKA